MAVVGIVGAIVDAVTAGSGVIEVIGVIGVIVGLTVSLVGVLVERLLHPKTINFIALSHILLVGKNYIRLTLL